MSDLRAGERDALMEAAKAKLGVPELDSKMKAILFRLNHSVKSAFGQVTIDPAKRTAEVVQRAIAEWERGKK